MQVNCQGSLRRYWGGGREGAGGLGGEPWDGIASHSGGSSNTPGRFMAKETRKEVVLATWPEWRLNLHWFLNF